LLEIKYGMPRSKTKVKMGIQRSKSTEMALTLRTFAESVFIALWLHGAQKLLEKPLVLIENGKPN
jgi:hypothetical protein